MQKARIILGMVVVVSAIVGFFGYRAYKLGEQKDSVTNDLKEFGTAYAAFQERHRRPPTSLDELKPFLEVRSPACQARVAEIEVIWGAPYDAKVEEADKRAFAFVKTFYAGKLATLYQDGNVKFLSENELQKSDKVRLPVAAPPAKTDEPKKAK